MLRRDLLIPALLGVGAAAFVSKAQANTPFTLFPFNATGGTTPRTMPDRLADIVNVKDYGAVGDGSHDDYPNIQAALDAAFTTSGSPNGVSNATKNRPVFFPNGVYLCNSGTPTINKIYGGWIYGVSSGSSVIVNGGGVPAFSINGAVGLIMERLALTGNNSTSTFALDLDWNNGTSNFVTNGLRHNTFSCISGGNAQGIRVANSGNDGANNLFQQVTLLAGYGGVQTFPGIEFKGTSAINNVILHSGIIGNPSILCSGGSAHMIGCDFAQESAPNYDLQVDSGYPVSVIGGRAESSNFAIVSNGILNMRSFTLASASAIATGCTISGATLTIGTGAGITNPQSIGQPVYYPSLSALGKVPVIQSNVSGSGSGSVWTLSYAPGNTSGLTINVGGLLAQAIGGRVTLDGCSAQNCNSIGSIATATGCSISGTTLTIGTLTAGALSVGQVLNYSGMPGLPSFSAAPSIIANISGSGNGSTWTLNYAPGNASGLAMRLANALYLRANFGFGLTGYNGIVSTGDQTVQNI